MKKRQFVNRIDSLALKSHNYKFMLLCIIIIGLTLSANSSHAFSLNPLIIEIPQQLIVKGKIVDENGIPLAGANVVEKGTTNGIMTDFEGNFNMTVSKSDAVLVISYLGYKTLEIKANADLGTLNLVLDASALNEIVLVGYGSTKRKDVTGAISSVSDKEMNQGAITNPLQLIAGKAAGVNVNQVGNEPGSTPSVRIRGISSLIGGNDPLVVVDGIQGNLDLLNQIPPSEIAFIDILKDASATAIYGSRGAPGVIIVSTKKSQAGTTMLEYTGSSSVDAIPRELDMLDSEQWWTQAQLTGVPASANHGSNTDWYNLLTQTGFTQTHNLSFGGGTDNFNYRASISAILQQGVVINSSNQKFIGRIVASQKALGDNLTLTYSLNNGIIKNKGTIQSIGRASFTSNLITNAYLMRPTDPVYDVDGSYFNDPNVFQYLNPYAAAQTVINEAEQDNLFGSLKADLNIYDGLVLGWFGSWRTTSNTAGFFLPVESTSANAIDQRGFANINNNNQDEKLMNISLSYLKEFGKNNINVLALYEWQNQTYQGNFSQVRGFINDFTTFNALQLGDLSNVRPGDISSYKNDRTLVSFLGRLNYSYLDRYLVTVSYRRDGSSVFGANNKWGNFPSAAVAWQIDQEPFMQNQKVFDYLKLRAGYGVTGNQQGLYPQNSLSLVGGSGVTYFGGQEINNFNIIQNANADLSWETKSQIDIGIDFALFKNRLHGTVDVYSATTDNLLFDYTVPQPPFPYSTIKANVGSILNEGLEISLAYDLINKEDMTLTLAGNASFMKNEVKNLSGSINGVPLNTDYVPWGPNSFLIEGQPIGTFNILHHTGKDDNNSETVQDVNGDGIIDQGNQSPDRMLHGSALPTYTYAFSPSFRYKNLDVSMLWRGSGGNEIFNSLNSSLSYLENIGRSNVLESASDLGIYTSQYSSDLWLEDGDFLRFENMTVGYTLGFGKIKYLDSIRISLTANNILIFTNYSGVDPELNFSGSNGFGGDNGTYPRTRSFVLGLDVKLN